MPGATKYEDLISAVCGSQQTYDWTFTKKITTALKSGGFMHRLQVNAVGSPGPQAEGTASPGTAYTSADGCITFPDQGSFYKHLASLGLTCYQRGITIMLYDRLVCTTFTNTTASKTLDTAALPRYTSGFGVQAWIECTTAVTSGTPSITMDSYTDEIGSTGQTGPALSLGSAPVIDQCWQLPVAAATNGVKAVHTVNFTAATGGLFQLVLMYPIAMISANIAEYNAADFITQFTRLPRIYDGASLALYINPTATTAVNDVFGQVKVLYT